jgi:protein-S-isoprenylcysteine O-methyltransferase Ste14
MFAVLVNVRPAPLRRGRSVIGVAAALTSQLAFILIGLVAGSSGSGAVLVASDILLGAGLLFAIASVAFLGRCFGVLPDVRGLVTRGPYRLVRHPLYLGELAAALGIALGAQRWAPALGAWLVCLGLQLVRTAYEERSLRAEFPEYAPYAERTKRLIPGLV